MPTGDAVSLAGYAIVYRLFDVGEEIDLERALAQLASSAPERARPVRGEAQALQIKNPPITVALGTETVAVDHRDVLAELSARIFDFGVVSVRARVDPGSALAWQEFTRFGLAVDATPRIGELLELHIQRLVERIKAAIERPRIAPVREDYNVYRVRESRAADNVPARSFLAQPPDLVPLLLGESRALSAEAQKELLPHRFSYYADDLTILSWDNVLVVDQSPGDTDVEFILEFANAQLLELRYYDALLDAELPKLYDRIEQARRRRGLLRTPYGDLLASMQTLVAETTEVVERAENALKVTDDVYLARIYSTALELYRSRVWRAGIDRKLTIIRETYGMLNGEAQARRAETLELAIIVLIVLEILISVVR